VRPLARNRELVRRLFSNYAAKLQDDSETDSPR
jgi:hypothetical protein